MFDIKDLKFFGQFAPAVIEKLQAVVTLKTFNVGDSIIEQDKANDCLYFLIQGKLGIYVDGGLVAKMDTPGDLLGEMSVISKQLSSATIKAESPSQLALIRGDDLDRITRIDPNSYFQLFKIYSDILVKKLESTNHRAKHFEEFAQQLEVAREKLEATNASLEIKVLDRTKKLALSVEELTQKNAELQASHDKLADLYQNRDITFSSLDTLLNKSLIPINESISQFEKSGKIKKDEISRLKKEVTRAIHRLEPLSASFNAEKSMTAKKVLLAEPKKKQHSVAKMALGGTGVELDIVQTEDEAKEFLGQKKYDIFMFSEDFLKLTDFAKECNPEMRFVFVTSRDIPEYVPDLLAHTIVPNVVSRDEEDKQFTIKNFVTTVSKLASGNYFGLEKYISWGVEVKSLEVVQSNQRREIIEAMDDYFARSGVRSANRGRTNVVAEELLMNAIYDAPRDSSGKPLYNHKSRTEDIVLNEAHRSVFRFATDGVLMAVSIEDPFGALDSETLFRYLEKCYAGGSLNDERADKGGGGRGLHQIIENSDLVVFNIDPGKRTEVIALFNTDQKSAVDRNPNLHFFKAG